MNTQTPDATHFLQFWLTIALIVSVLSGIASMFAAFGGRKQKREVSFTFTPASKEEFDQFTATTNQNFVQIRDEMKQDRHDNQIHTSQRQEKLFAEMKSTRLELDGKIEATRRELSEKIDGMEQRVIATLKNTSAI